MGWKHYELGWHSTGTIAHWPLPQRLRSIPAGPKRGFQCLGVAASSASGLRINFGTMTKSYHAGMRQ